MFNIALQTMHIAITICEGWKEAYNLAFSMEQVIEDFKKKFNDMIKNRYMG